MAVDVEKIYSSTWEHYQRAKKNLKEQRALFEHSADAISDVIPGFKADKLC